jgi:hypothetical protein
MSEPVDSKTGQPIGATVDARPAQRLGPVTLEGRYGRVEKLEAKHAASLWVAVKGDDRLWTYMAYGPFTDASSFASWVSERAGSPTRIPTSWSRQLAAPLASSH